MTMGSLQDKIVLITGGSRGIGRAIVQACAKEGAHVAFTFKSAGVAAEEVLKEVHASGREGLALQSDAKDFAAAQQTVDAVVAKWGRIDVLINNAGITKDGLLMRMSEQDWDDVIDTNLKSAFNFSKAVCRPMMGQRSGAIVNISSISGVMGNAGQSNYAAAKAGLEGFSRSLAREVGSRSITVNSVTPGFIDTDMTRELPEAQREALQTQIPLGRLGKLKRSRLWLLFLRRTVRLTLLGLQSR